MKKWYTVVAVPQCEENKNGYDTVMFEFCMDTSDKLDMRVLEEVAGNKISNMYGNKYRNVPVHIEYIR